MEEEKKKTIMGAIIGDIVGSRFEFLPTDQKDFGFYHPNCFFTDDSVMTLAICKALLECGGKKELLRDLTVKNMRQLGHKYENAGYGGSFRNWLLSENPQPYNSYGNGSAMRVSGVAYCADSLEEVKELSKMVTDVTHNHPEGIKGAEATAVAMWFALHGKTKEEIKDYIEQNYYSLDFDYDDLVANYGFGEACQNTVPQSIYAFLISTDFEDAIRTTVSLGGDADTMGAITGAIAGAYYGVPKHFAEYGKYYLTDDLLKIVEDFDEKINR